MYKRFMILAALLAIACASARAQFGPNALGTYEPFGSSYLVRLTLDNSNFNEPLAVFSVYTRDASEICTPDGWHSYWSGRSVDWDANGPADYLQLGKTLSGFNYMAQNPPGTMSWWIWATISGVHVGTVTPTFVPEPTSLFALGGGVLVVGLPWLRRRRAA